MWILAQLLTEITGKPRYKPEIWWRYDSLVHNIFMLWKMIFWAPSGIRFENSASITSDGSVIYRFGTWEALSFWIEESIKNIFRRGIRVPISIEIPLFRLPTGGVIPTSPYLFAIAFDTSSDFTAGTSPSLSFTRGTSASNYIGLTYMIAFGGSRTCSGVTWGGTSMTQLFTAVDPLLAAGANDYLFYIIAPPSGAQTVAATTTASYGGVVATFSGVNQTTPFDTNFDGASNPFKSQQTNASTTGSVSGTTHVDNSVGVGAQNSTVSTGAAGSNTTVSGGFLMYNTTAITPAGTDSLNVTGASQNWWLYGSALQPAAASTTKKHLLMLMGVGS